MVLEKYINLSQQSFMPGMATYDEQVRLFPMAEVADSTVEELNSEIAENPEDAELYLKKGIALSRASLHHQEAIDTFSQGLYLEPFNAMLYRWRGHKYLNVRQFRAGRADLELASRLDPSNWDTWYHLGLGNYLLRDFARAEAAYRQCWALTNSEDKRVAVTDWLYMTLMRQGKPEEALSLLDFVTPDTDAGRNDSYFRRLLMYKGFVTPEELLADADVAGVDYVTLGYGLGNYYYCAGNHEKAAQIWQSVLDGKYWSAFGYVASEVEVLDLSSASK